VRLPGLGLGETPPPAVGNRALGASAPEPGSLVEPMTGIEPAYSAWEADVLPLNYIGNVAWEG
jgi:hypothetical protein